MNPVSVIQCVQSLRSTLLTVSESSGEEAVSFLSKNDLDHQVEFLHLWAKEVATRCKTESQTFLVCGILDAIQDLNRDLSSLHTSIHERRTSWWWTRWFWHDASVRRHLHAVRLCTLRLHHRVETYLRVFSSTSAT